MHRAWHRQEYRVVVGPLRGREQVHSSGQTKEQGEQDETRWPPWRWQGLSLYVAAGPRWMDLTGVAGGGLLYRCLPPHRCALVVTPHLYLSNPVGQHDVSAVSHSRG